jgi:hypothetical protein
MNSGNIGDELYTKLIRVMNFELQHSLCSKLWLEVMLMLMDRTDGRLDPYRFVQMELIDYFGRL